VSTYEFGEWDADSSSFYNPGPVSSPGPFLSPLLLSTVGLSPAPLPEVSFQAAESAYISYPPSPITNEHRSVTPELRYPSPVPSPQRTPVSSIRSTFHEPSPRPQSLPPVSQFEQTIALTGGRFSASPIDYETSARRLLSENPDDEELQIVLGYHPPRTGSPIRLPLRPRAPSPAITVVDNDENIPPAPVIRPPPCSYYDVAHPHQFILVATQRGAELRHPDHYSQTVQKFILVDELLARPPVFPGVTPFRAPSPHLILINPVNRQEGLVIGNQTLYACSQAIIDFPSEDIPLGSIRYTFATGIKSAFEQIPVLARRAYEGTFVVLDIHDFLDGRVVTTYGYLAFGDRNGQGDAVFVTDQNCHFQDGLRENPRLAAFTLLPRIPSDPHDYLHTYYEDQPL
jgi:hypothetical protein